MVHFLAFTLLAASTSDAFFCADTFTSGTATFENGFGSGEEAAVRIDPPADALPLSLTNAWLFYGQNNDQSGSTETIKIYDVDGVDFTGAPGTVIGSSPAPLLDSTDSIQQVTFTSPIVVHGPFWVALHMDRTGPAAGPATDGTSGSPTTSAIFADASDGQGQIWHHASDLLVHGAWVLRVEGDAQAPQSDGACRIGGGGEGEGEGAGGEGEGSVGEGEGSTGEGEGATSGLVVTSVNPSSAAEHQTARITVTGSGFTSSTAVRVGSASCGDLSVQNPGALLCTVPATLPADTYDVIAQNGADVFVFPSGFTVTPVAAPKSGCSCTTTPVDAPLEVGLALIALVAPPRGKARPRGRFKRTARYDAPPCPPRDEGARGAYERRRRARS